MARPPTAASNPLDGEFDEEAPEQEGRLERLEQALAQLAVAQQQQSELLSMFGQQLAGGNGQHRSALSRVRWREGARIDSSALNVEGLMAMAEQQDKTYQFTFGGAMILARDGDENAPVYLFNAHGLGMVPLATAVMRPATIDQCPTFACPFPNLAPGRYEVRVGNMLFGRGTEFTVVTGEITWVDLRR